MAKAIRPQCLYPASRFELPTHQLLHPFNLHRPTPHPKPKPSSLRPVRPPIAFTSAPVAELGIQAAEALDLCPRARRHPPRHQTGEFDVG